MNILVTNDDGIFADGLWILVEELKRGARVVVVAPDREQSAVGTAVTLSQPLRVHRVRPLVPGVEAYSVTGTPADCVILASGKLVTDKIDLVISGINHGLNLGNDVLISGFFDAKDKNRQDTLPVHTQRIWREAAHVYQRGRTARYRSRKGLKRPRVQDTPGIRSHRDRSRHIGQYI